MENSYKVGKVGIISYPKNYLKPVIFQWLITVFRGRKKSGRARACQPFKPTFPKYRSKLLNYIDIRVVCKVGINKEIQEESGTRFSPVLGGAS